MNTEELFAKHLLDTKDVDIKDGLTGNLGKFIRSFWGFEYTCFLAGYSANEQRLKKDEEHKEMLNKQIDGLDARLEEAEEVVAFYADKVNWKVCEQYRPWNNYSVITNDLDESSVDESTLTVYCGKKAREYQSKHQKHF